MTGRFHAARCAAGHEAYGTICRGVVCAYITDPGEMPRWRLVSSQAGGLVMLDKRASSDYPIHELLAICWSPYAFADRPVSEADLCSLFEAVRWAASSFNEQPWSYIVATREVPGQFAQLLSCLVEFNQVWAQAAPVLALGVVSL
jgi:hypothetical protein